MTFERDPLVFPVSEVSWAPLVVLPVNVTVAVIREPRDHCVNCRARRVLYRVVVSTSAGDDKTEARCAPCWGIR